MGPFHAAALGQFGHVTAGLEKMVGKIGSLELFPGLSNRLVEILLCTNCNFGFGQPGAGSHRFAILFCIDLFAVGRDEHTLDEITQLPHVTGPGPVA